MYTYKKKKDMISQLNKNNDVIENTKAFNTTD